MAEKIQLEIHSFSIREQGQEEALNLGIFYNENNNRLSFLDTFLRFSQSLTEMKVDDVTQRTFEVQNESIRVQDERIFGIMEYGTFGYAADLKNIRNQNVNYRRNTTDTEQRPYYFMIYAPKNYDVGFLILQRTGINGIKSILENSMRKFYREDFNNLTIDISPVIPEQLINRYIDEGNFGSITIFRYGLPGDLADQVLDDEARAVYDTDDVKVEITLTKRGGAIPSNRKVRNFLNDPEASFFNIQQLTDLGFDNNSTIQIESTLGGKKRKINLGDHMKFRPYYDINDELTMNESGNPTFDSIHSAANSLLNDLLGMDDQ